MKTNSASTIKLEDLDMAHLDKYDVLTLIRASCGVLRNKRLKKQIENNLRERNCINDLLGLERTEHDAEIQNIIGFCYANGFCGGQEDKKAAFGWYKKAAEQGNSKAQYYLACCYACGAGCKKDDHKYFEWCKKSAEQGDAEAQYQLGNSYRIGSCCEKNKRQAIKWFEKSAEQGYEDALDYLVSCYLYGWICKEDRYKAFEWCKKAAGQGMAYAQYLLGLFYRCGVCCELDEKKSFCVV